MDHRVIMNEFKKDNWEIIEQLDNWLYVFDHLPVRMRIYVDFKIQGMQNKEIAVICRVSVNCVEKQLRRAKIRFLRGENVL